MGGGIRDAEGVYEGALLEGQTQDLRTVTYPGYLSVAGTASTIMILRCLSCVLRSWGGAKLAAGEHFFEE